MKFSYETAFLCFPDRLGLVLVCALSNTQQRNRYLHTSMKEIGTYLRKHIAAYPSNDVLCTFDLDNTLLTIDSPFVQYRCKYRSVWEKLRKHHPDITTAMLYRALAPHVRLTKSDVLPLLQSLKIKTIAFTASGTGVHAGGRSMELYCYEELKGKGITFENAFPFKQLLLEE